MKRLFRITETAEVIREAYVEAESWTEARKLYAEGIDKDEWEEFDPSLAKIELTLIDGHDIEYSFMNEVATLELTGFSEDDKAIEELDKELNKA